MAAGHGGARPGSGRKPKTSKKVASTKPTALKSEDRPATGPSRYADALAYLEAVVRGDEPADGLRIAAAKAVLPFQAPRARAPVESPPPRALRASAEKAAGKAAHDDWESRAAAVRAKFNKGPLQ